MGIVIVSGALANRPRNAGGAWVRLSWIRGLQRLGLEVYFIEQIDQATCVGATGQPAPIEQSINLSWFNEWTRYAGLAGRAALITADGDRTFGLSQNELLDVAGAADLLVNISGHLRLESLLRRVGTRVYLDIDPGFTQFWHAAGEVDFRIGGHNHYFTIAENIGQPFCPIPIDDIQWRTTRQPVVLDDWPVSATAQSDRFTTVANWRGEIGRVEFNGTIYGQKVHEFRKFLDVPVRAPGTFEIALDIHPSEQTDIQSLRQHGWCLSSPELTVPDPLAFRSYVQESGAEFSVAQGIYVDTSSGWFSDRTTRYLASGKPVLVQETGFCRQLPVGEGLVSFRSLEEAVSGAERIVGSYESHARSARQIAEEYFGSDQVLSQFVDEVRVAP